jgi:ATP-dependent Lhr-like helicase
MPLDTFHPAVRDWFQSTFDAPTPTQLEGWKAIADRRDTLIAAPTGSGKTLAAFLAVLDDLTREAVNGTLDDGVRVVYVSPLRALSNDIERNLQAPLAGISERLRDDHGVEAQITAGLRTGDTPRSERTRMTKTPPHILVTTPESLYILLGSDGGRGMLEGAHTVIVDEIHAVASNRRGSHLSLTLERLDTLVGERLVRIGLSATQRPIEEVGRFLVGSDAPDPDIVDAGHERDLDLQVEVTGSPLQAVMSAEHMDEVYDRLAELIEEHDTTIVFTNTRREAERVTRNLADRLGEELVASHHGSLSRERRFDSEQSLKEGRLKALVATASMELGIDVGIVDLVCQLGSVRAIGTLLQRVGRSGHHLGGVPKGRVFPLTLDELVEASALVWAIRRGELDRLEIPDAPLDLAAQHIVAAAGNDEWSEDELYQMIRRAHPYRTLTRERFEELLSMLADGFSTRRGRRGAHIHWDQVNGRVRGRRGARLTAITSGGAIPERADYRVVMDHDETFVGTLDEDFAIESMPGDIFQLGNTSWQIARIDSRNGQVRVYDAKGKPPTIPFWFGEAPARTLELSETVSSVREEVDARLAVTDDGVDVGEALTWARDDVGLGRAAAEQLVNYLGAARQALGVMPTRRRVVVERFFDEAGNTHLVVHSPFGSRLNRGWGLALRKRFCRSFNFELQAAANEDAIILSMGPTHSFPLIEVFDFLSSTTVRDVLVQALLDAPMFGTRWRWNLNRSLAVPRFRGGRKVAPQIQRMQAEDLLAVVFPDQLACLENIAGDREVPDHPIVDQTIRDCLEEAMDIEGLETLLRDLEAGRIETVARDVREPSPLSHQVINARPYAFLDDAPLEERRTMAVQTRGMLDPDTVGNLADLDPDAVDRVRDEVAVDVRDADELHDAIVCHAYLTQAEIDDAGVGALLDDLRGEGRVTRLRLGTEVWVPAERILEFEAVFDAAKSSDLEPPARFAGQSWERQGALTEIVRSRLEYSGPIRAEVLIGELGLESHTIEATLLGLESEGFAFRGAFDQRIEAEQWCERGLLARIHRYTLARLRREIRPVSPADYMRFLFRWQHVADDARVMGPDGLAKVLEQLSGVHAAAGAWESELLPARVDSYDPGWLDMACMSGQFAWGRLRGGGGRAPIRTSPMAICLREELQAWAEPVPDPEISSAANKLRDVLADNGASFFGDLARESRLLKTKTEAALGELVASGLVTSDSFVGLRALLVPQDKRPDLGRHRRSLVGAYSVDAAGRWTLLGRDVADEPTDEQVEAIAWRLLHRWGVVLRKVARRESRVGWRRLLAVYRRLEARGEVRGGRFVNGLGGEQFALPEAVSTMRKVRRKERDGALVAINACDPLNLTGVVVGDERITATLTNRLVFRDGVLVAALEGSDKRFFGDGEVEAELERVLVRKPSAPRVRSYLRR